MPKKIFKGRALAGGVAEGEAIVSKMTFGWAGSLNPKTGEVIDKRLDIYKKNLKGKIFIFPYGRGSTTGGTVILEAVRNKLNPVAVVNVEMEPMTLIGVLLAPIFYKVKIPAVDKLDEDPTVAIKTGDKVRVDGNKGIVEVL